ncbi:CD7 isoform 7 [Pan troglodytes]|uniref:CD7 isoform 7 n=1 Tax=Pan troglodytes TaxID=9598 RepID=A0A2J8JFH0_PANTR|nr:CD7 isoform 7 [Pan troglodytes]
MAGPPRLLLLPLLLALARGLPGALAAQAGACMGST